MTEQLGIGSVRLTNEEGARRGLAQLDRIGRGWELEYDRREDVLLLRKAGHGPAVAYFLTRLSEVNFYLDGQGDLVGVDLADFRRALIPQFPELRFVLRAWRLNQLAQRVPGIRTIAGWFRDDSLPTRARDQVNALASSRLCTT